MGKEKGGKLKICLASLLILMLLLVIFSISKRTGSEMKTIPGWLLAPSVPEPERFIRYQPENFAVPIQHIPIPQHPFMAPGLRHPHRRGHAGLFGRL